uniref:alpha,alpha-trehalose-phosphate synthase (UDP-forming) n=1 Tax=Haemonchus placei TaxID=6290 RepID=A0A0N4X3S9_HAEPC
LLGVNAKQFGEKFHHLQKKISRHSSMGSMESIDSDGKDDEQSRCSLTQRVINVSNAPPVSLKREKTGDWEIKQGSGGLVACVDPVMNKDRENIWLANLGMNLKDKRKKSMSSEDSECSAMAPSTNTLGLPLIKQAIAEVLFHVLADDDKPEKESNAEQRKAREEMSLLGVLNNYNRGNYKLNPVIVQEEDYNVYYGGISNGLLWPALHNLPEYIVADYDTPKILRDHWCAYVRVNYQFAIDAVRNSRPQDFIWIHDYHLMLTGMIMQSLDPNLDVNAIPIYYYKFALTFHHFVGFFLHTPFQPPDTFFTKYVTCGLPVLRGLLRFTKVGFQTHRDRAKYLELVQQHLKGVSISVFSPQETNSVTHEGWTCSLGVFPVSIKNDDFLKFVHMPESVVKKEAIRKKILGTNPPKGSRFFFSVERFDYTKGIKEKLVAYKRYFEKYPDHIRRKLSFQVAVTNRRSVDTYRVYQDECIDLAKQIVEKFKDPNRAEWKPLVFQTDGLPRPELVAAYMAMDIGIVTPKKDGMNLVAKEMLVCNPQAGLILSTGAGSEIQFTTSGLYKEDGEKNYHRVSNLYDVEAYADTFYAAATEPVEVRAAHGKRLSEFILSNDIERWSAAFLDPSWTHQVIRPTQVG